MTDELAILESTFRDLPHVLFCLKNEEGRYIAANLSFAQRCGLKSVKGVIGRSAAELFPDELAASYESQDRAVISTGRRVVNHLETIPRPDGEQGWFLTTKLKAGSEGDPLVVVVSVDLNAPVSSSTALDHLSGMLTAVRNDPGNAWRVAHLAKMVGVSERQLERRVQRVLGVTVKTFLQAERLRFAAALLTSSSLTLAEVAATAGYYDQSQFSREFRAAVGLTPGQYRRI